jgi:hypothetical protein
MEQWEACALSLNINPDNMQHHGLKFTADSYPNEAIKVEFRKRLRLLGAYAFKPEFFKGGHFGKVTLQEFAAWGLHVEIDDMPPELFAMAAPEAPTVPAQNAATTAPGVDGTATPDPERRLAALRELGGTAKYKNREWSFTGITKLVQDEKGRPRCDVKTIRSDLKEAAQTELDAKSAGHFDGLRQR